jgi:hypothetical protein
MEGSTTTAAFTPHSSCGRYSIAHRGGKLHGLEGQMRVGIMEWIAAIVVGLAVAIIAWRRGKRLAKAKADAERWDRNRQA